MGWRKGQPTIDWRGAVDWMNCASLRVANGSFGIEDLENNEDPVRSGKKR